MTDNQRRTPEEIQQDNELLLKFYRQENYALTKAVELRDKYIISAGMLSDFSSWVAEGTTDG